MPDLFGRKPLKLPTVCQPAAKSCVDCGAPCGGIFCDGCADKPALGLGAPKEKRQIKHLEDALHLQVASYLRAAIGPAGVTNQHGARWVSHAPEHKGHLMTGRNGRKFYAAGKRAKDKGAVRGQPDVEVLWNRIGHHIELKEPGRRNEKDGGLSRGQVDAHRELRAAGVPVAVCYTVAEVETALRGWNVPLRAKVAA